MLNQLLSFPPINLMFYSEKLQSPISTENVKRIYGINPNNTLVASRMGIYPLTQAPAGFSPRAFKKVGTSYQAVAHEFSDADRMALQRIKAISGSASAIVAAHIADWNSSTTYATDDIVEHSGSVYKAKRASTNVEPGVFVNKADETNDNDPDWLQLH